jgi:multicomponent Na+:H+ antiporter subunit G
MTFHLIIAYIFIIIGIVFIFIGILGFFRFKNFYAKLHAASLIESCGVPLCIFGLIFMQNSTINIIKLLIMMILIFLMGPVSSHNLAKTSLENNNIL